MTELLEIVGLSVAIHSRGRGRPVEVLRDVSLEVAPGEVVGLVGESGGGKTMVARAVVGLLPEGAHATGQVGFNGADVLRMSSEELRRHRGHGAALCFQNPRGALSPTRTVGRQLTDRLVTHQGMGARAARETARELFEAVGIRNPARRLDAYPHELSGGMAQRVMISLVTGCAPGLLLADEPTTGLDVTLAREILHQFRELASGTGELSRELASGTGELSRELASGTGELSRQAADAGGRGVLLISHDLASIAQVCDRVVVLRAGRVVESGPARQVLRTPDHAYTRELLAAVPDLGGPVRQPRPATDRTVLAVEDAHVVYRSRFSGGGHHALRGVSLQVRAGETVGVVGESGCGKSTLARLILGLVQPSAGTVTVAGQDLSRVRGRQLRELRTRAQLVFQDPIGSLSPRRTVADAIAEPLRAQRVPAAERAGRVAEGLARMGLDESFLARRPHQLSGGQAQRVGIARALVGRPDLLVFDEPTSALDVTVQAQILQVIAEVTAGSVPPDSGRLTAGSAALRPLAADTHGSVFISHDLATVRSFCDRVVVLYLGRVVEEGPVAEVFAHPRHPYTRALLSSVTTLGSGGAGFTGPRVELVKDLEEADARTGCPLAPRCPLATDRCWTDAQVLTDYGPSRAACWRVPEFSWEGGSVAR